MADREKVIKGLECCSSGNMCKGKCPYDELGCEWTDCVRPLAEDALSLLKEQEPRVMTSEEWENAPEPLDGECMCYEIKDKGLEAVLVKAFKGCKEYYGKDFRCWTSRPTDEQRMAVMWDAAD